MSAQPGDARRLRHEALDLERALLHDPQDAASALELAQRYRDAGETDLALRWYRKRAEMGGAAHEVWYALYQIAVLEQRAEKPWPEVLQAYLRAYQHDPSRADPLFRIALAYQARREHRTAMLYLAPAAAIPAPPDGTPFADRALYDVQIPLEHAVASFYLGDHETAVATNNRLLRSGALPAALIEHVISNRRFSLDARVPRAEPRAEPVRLHAIVVYRDPGPELDDLVDSLLGQTFERMRVTFADDGSREDQAERLPLDDPRFRLVRAEPRGFEQAVRRQVADDDDVVVALTPAHRLADAHAFATAAQAFADPGCALLHGQFRRADGSLGDAEPAESASAFAARGVAFAGGAPLFARAALMRAAAAEVPLLDAVWNAAGFAGARFTDRALTVAAPQRQRPIVDASSPSPRDDGPPSPRGADAAVPLISCLMVTYDRVVLAKRALRSFAEQTWPNRELVVVTDGAPRFRRALEDEVAAAGIEGVRFVYVEPGRNLGMLRNLALDAARGELVCQWDDDDYSHPERLAVQARDLLVQGADASFLSEHLQLIEDRRTAFWLDWTGGGAQSGAASWFPGTLMMRRAVRARYPEEGRFARTGEDTALMHALAASVPVAGLGGHPHLYLYQYHGRNVFSEEHHQQLRVWGVSAERLAREETRIRETLLHAAVPRPTVVAGSDAPAFVVA